MPRFGPQHYALIPVLTVFGYLHPTALVALLVSVQILDHVRNWPKPAP